MCVVGVAASPITLAVSLVKGMWWTLRVTSLPFRMVMFRPYPPWCVGRGGVGCLGVEAAAAYTPSRPFSRVKHIGAILLRAAGLMVLPLMLYKLVEPIVSKVRAFGRLEDEAHTAGQCGPSRHRHRRGRCAAFHLPLRGPPRQGQVGRFFTHI